MLYFWLSCMVIVMVLTVGHMARNHQKNQQNKFSVLSALTCLSCDIVKMEGPITDCSCDYGTVNKAITKFYQPILTNVTELTFFRYFRVDLEQPCPFWHEEGQCMMEGCSVGTCEENEVPHSWKEEQASLYHAFVGKGPQDSSKKATFLQSNNPFNAAAMNGNGNEAFGWISSQSSSFDGSMDGQSDALGRLNMSSSQQYNHNGMTSSSTTNNMPTSINAGNHHNGISSKYLHPPHPTMNNDMYLKYLRDTEDADNDWTDMSEDDEMCRRRDTKTDLFSTSNGGGGGFYGMGGSDCEEKAKEGKPQHMPQGAYVNLLQNPERYTGYAGPSAARVWKSIQQENCFGGQDDTCLEKRVFYRLMSGLQASISTLIAREYYYPEGFWGHNLPLYVRAVGSHPDRLSNLYFTFLFVLRAVVKAGDLLVEYPYHTGHTVDDINVQKLVKRLVKAGLPRLPPASVTSPRQGEYGEALLSSSSVQETSSIDGSTNSVSGSNGLTSGSEPASISGLGTDGTTNSHRHGDNHGNGTVVRGNVLAQCRNGFDESLLFQVPISLEGVTREQQYWQEIQQEKSLLKEEFRLRFRNISRIMDCVTCEKCRVWGKLQILGLGTAIKILLTPESELSAHAGSVSGVLNRQEIIALINTLHQLSKSLVFAAHAGELELKEKLYDYGQHAVAGGIVFLLVFSFIVFQFRRIYYQEKEDYATIVQELLGSSFRGDLTEIKILCDLMRGRASIHRIRDSRQCSPMHMAALNNHVHIVEYLVETWRVSTNEKRDDGWTCLHIAASQGYAAMVSYLLRHKSEVDMRTAQGETALHLAAHNNHLAIIELLVTVGKANLELTDRDERTPLYVAARQGHLGAVQYLVELGSKMDTTNDIGWTPLVMACRNNHLAVATYLIGKGADMEKRDNWGRTALFISASEGRAQMVSLLGRNGASLIARHHNGQLPINVAQTEEIRQIILDEEKRQRDHGFKRTPRESTTEDNNHQESGGGGGGGGNGVASEVQEEDDDDESSDEGQ